MTDDLDAMGLIFHKHMTWGFTHGHLRWAPYWVRRLICNVWNFVSCRLFGHFIIDEFELEKHLDVNNKMTNPRIICTHCCKTFTREEYNRLEAK